MFIFSGGVDGLVIGEGIVDLRKSIQLPFLHNPARFPGTNFAPNIPSCITQWWPLGFPRSPLIPVRFPYCSHKLPKGGWGFGSTINTMVFNQHMGNKNRRININHQYKPSPNIPVYIADGLKYINRYIRLILIYPILHPSFGGFSRFVASTRAYALMKVPWPCLGSGCLLRDQGVGT